MTGPILAKLVQIINHRADMAQRWHGINDIEKATELVWDDPDVQACFQNPVIAKEAERQALTMVIADIISGVNIAEHRERFGDEFVDRILEVYAQAI